MFIKNFRQLTNKDTASAGGKGASLGEMTQAKIPVPPGFVVLASAFQKFIEETDINIEIDAMWDRLEAGNTEEIERNSEMMQSLITGKEFPKDLAEEIIKDFDELGTKHVAVRSSATAEDSKLDAWAGQLDSYLYVDKKGLLKAVQRCWASLFTPRAIFYRLERKLQKNKIAVAVVIQKMANSDVSGVCFTVHPVTRDRDQMIIEAGWGLGEAIVQGIITPDNYVIEKSTLKIVDVNVNSQEKQIVKAKIETGEKPVSEKLRNKQKLTEKQIKELAKICINIEKHYGDPRDIEWALEKNKFYITQSRPITTL
jgi:pyruvate,water dikinase